MNKTDDAAFLHTFTILLLALTAVGLLAFVLAGFVTNRAESGQTTEVAGYERTRPTGKINYGTKVVEILSIPSINPSAIEHPSTSAPPSTELDKDSLPETTSATKSGKDVYNQACSLCHMAGVAGAPRYADSSAWKPRIEKGLDLLYTNAINGYVGSAGVMPAKGGRPDLEDEEVKSAVDYIVSSVNQ